MLERVVPWRSVSWDNLQDGLIELMTVCKGSVVEKSFETQHSRRVWGSVVRKLEAAQCKGREINIYKNPIFCTQNL